MPGEPTAATSDSGAVQWGLDSLAEVQAESLRLTGPPADLASVCVQPEARIIMDWLCGTPGRRRRNRADSESSPTRWSWACMHPFNAATDATAAHGPHEPCCIHVSRLRLPSGGAACPAAAPALRQHDSGVGDCLHQGCSRQAWWLCAKLTPPSRSAVCWRLGRPAAQFEHDAAGGIGCSLDRAYPSG